MEDRRRFQELISNRNTATYEGEKLAVREIFMKTVNAVTDQIPPEVTNFIPYYCDLKNFFFTAFPVISLSIYRMLESTQWLEVPFFGPFNEPYELS